MKHLLLIVLFLASKLAGECLSVSDTATQCTSNNIQITHMNHALTLKSGSSVDIPLYVSSDSDKKITMTLHNISALKNSKGGVIATTMTYIRNGSERTIYDGSTFTLLSEGEGPRNGSNVGTLRIKVATIDALQTAGEYKLDATMYIALDTVSETAQASLTTKGSIDYLTLVAFEDVLSSYTEGERFIDSVIDYGNLKFYKVNTISKNLYVKNNTPNNITVSFTPSDLTHTIFPKHKIKMKYSYTPNSGSTHIIEDNTAFTVAHGKQNGGVVGVMKFNTELIRANHLAGEYKAVLNITVQARL